jgi:hypothetical protein
MSADSYLHQRPIFFKANSSIVAILELIRGTHRQTSGESASLPQYLGCNTVFDMRLRVTFLRRMRVLKNVNYPSQQVPS